MRHLLWLSILLSFASHGYAAADKAKSVPCTTTVADIVRAVDHSVPNGLIRHGEHWVDLILTQGGLEESAHVNAFVQLTEDLIGQIKRGTIPETNEKIDGSPSVVVGFNPEQKPFISYKGEIARKRGPQKLITSAADARSIYSSKPGLADLYAEAIKALRPALNRLSDTPFKDYLFQGDLLFIAGDPTRIKKTPDQITITANQIQYTVSKDDPNFQRISNAGIGIVIHTLCKRVIEPNGQITTEPVNDKKIISQFVEALTKNSSNIFVMDPWKSEIKLNPANSLDVGRETLIRKLLAEIRSQIQSLTPEFRELWGKTYEREFRVFFNSHLRPPAVGGIYLAAKNEEVYNFKQWLDAFQVWEKSRIPSLSLEGLHLQSLENLIAAYYNAIRVQALLMPLVPEIFQSKLGGGEVEGVMLSTEGTIVKWVDRLNFTLRNNQAWNRTLQAFALDEADELPEPFNKWHPGAAFVIMKGQPIHAGHIELIKKAAALEGVTEVFVIISDKAPNLRAKEWKDLGITKTKSKKSLKEKDYTYVYTAKQRINLLEDGIHDLRIKFYSSSILNFWAYLQKAKSDEVDGRIKLIVGEKEIKEDRYLSQQGEYAQFLEVVSVPLQFDGISGTEMRNAIRDYAEGDSAKKEAALKTLDRGLSYISDEKTRRSAIRGLVKQWAKVDDTVKRLIEQK